MPSAIADILDNSITACSKNIQILVPPGRDTPIISILDDGYGMSSEDLISCMRIGCKDPSIDRDQGDLGRFGSGMKTASFSQARRLTVISKAMDSSVSCAIWDIDLIEKENTWCLEVVEGKDIENVPFVKIDENCIQGTQIIWEKLSCIRQGDHAIDHDEELASQIMEIKRHIALHFHRFMQGKEKVNFSINGDRIDPIDPFLTNARGYQEGRSERLRCKGGHIVIQTHVLPHIKNISDCDLDFLGGADGISQGQGLYIYRERRLIIAGGWMGLARNSQLGALARVQVDVPATLDHEWSTDVKKSSLQLPTKVKRGLRKFLSDPIVKSKKAYTYRGKQDVANKFWKICEDEDSGTITYHVDPENMKLQELLKQLNSEDRIEMIKYLSELSSNLPLNHIYQKMSESPKEIQQETITTAVFASILDKIF